MGLISRFYRGDDAGTQFGFAAPLTDAVAVGELLVVVEVDGVVLELVLVLVLGVAVEVLGDAVVEEPMVLPLVVPSDPVLLDPVLVPVVPLTVPPAVAVPVAGTPVDVPVLLAGTVPTGHGLAVVAPPATDPLVPVVPGVVVEEPDVCVDELTLAGVPIVEEVLAGVPVEVVPVVVLCGLAPTEVGVPTDVGVPIVEVPLDVPVVPVVPVAPTDPVWAVPAAPGVLVVLPAVAPPVVCATTQHESARTAASKRMLRVRM